MTRLWSIYSLCCRKYERQKSKSDKFKHQFFISVWCSEGKLSIAPHSDLQRLCRDVYDHFTVKMSALAETFRLINSFLKALMWFIDPVNILWYSLYVLEFLLKLTKNIKATQGCVTYKRNVITEQNIKHSTNLNNLKCVLPSPVLSIYIYIYYLSFCELIYL